MNLPVEVEISKIKIDDIFNSRGHIGMLSVDDLAKDILKHGLESPIILWKTDKYPGFEYLCVAGNRRLTAFKKLKQNTIPAFIKVGLTYLEAISINLRENLLRQDLNMVQEAHTLKAFFDAGWLESEIAVEFGKSNNWVQVRQVVNRLPADIQECVAAGLLNQQQIKDLDGRPSKEQYEMVKAIKDARAAGEKPPVIDKPPIKPTEKARRNPTQITDMILALSEKVGYGLHTRAMAWCSGDISEAELWVDAEEYAKANGMPFNMPSHIKKVLSNA